MHATLKMDIVPEQFDHVPNAAVQHILCALSSLPVEAQVLQHLSIRKVFDSSGRIGVLSILPLQRNHLIVDAQELVEGFWCEDVASVLSFEVHRLKSCKGREVLGDKSIVPG